MNSYECMFILDPDLEDEARDALINTLKETVEKNNGEVEEITHWGKRQLAYKIKKKTEGYYVLMNFKIEPSNVQELDRVYKISEGVLRHMIVRR